MGIVWQDYVPTARLAGAPNAKAAPAGALQAGTYRRQGNALAIAELHKAPPIDTGPRVLTGGI